MAIDNDAFGQALEKRIAKIEADRENGSNRDFDAWDKAELDYLTAACERLARGDPAEEVRARAARELPALEESVAREESCPTFDWYDDHHYEKVYSGQLAACRFILRTYEEPSQA